MKGKMTMLKVSDVKSAWKRVTGHLSKLKLILVIFVILLKVKHFSSIGISQVQRKAKIYGKAITEQSSQEEAKRV